MTLPTLPIDLLRTLLPSAWCVAPECPEVGQESDGVTTCALHTRGVPQSIRREWARSRKRR